MSAEIFVETASWKHQQETFTSRGCRLAGRAKQQRGPEGLELSVSILGSR